MPSTTPRGYPYPLPTEPVAEGAAAIRSLAESLDAEIIAAQSLSTAAAFNFPAIPQTFTHLFLIGRLRISGPATNDPIALRFNGDTAAANYAAHQLMVNPTPNGTALASSSRCGHGTANGDTFGGFGTLEVEIPGYRETVGARSWLGKSFSAWGTALAISVIGGKWQNTAPITRVEIFSEGYTSFVPGSVLALYGRRGPGPGAAAKPGPDEPDVVEPRE